LRRPASLPIPILGRTGGRAFEGGFDPSFTDYDGRTIRQIGKTSGDEAIELLARDFQARRNRPATAERAVNAMLDAAEKGRVDDLGRLLDSHLDLIDARDCNSARTALHMSTWRNRADCVRLLVQIRDYRDNVYALHFAPEAADLDVWLAIEVALIEATDRCDRVGDMALWPDRGRRGSITTGKGRFFRF
jgi:hypothetical protein